MIVFENLILFSLFLGITGLILLGIFGWKAKKEILFGLDKKRAQKIQVKKYIVAVSLVTFLILAIASSGFSTEADKSYIRESQIILLVDVSGSMAAKKGLNAPNRLERTKDILLEIVASFPRPEISLSGFTNLARSLSPFVGPEDRSYLIRSIEEVLDINSVPGFGTDFRQAILDVVDKFSEDNRKKLIILFSDGEQFRGKPEMTNVEETLLETVLQAAIQKNITIITVGVGEKEGATIPIFDEEGKFTDRFAAFEGKIYVTYLKEEILQKIADKTGGKYFFERDRQVLISHIGDNLVSKPIEERELYRDINYLLLFPIAAFWMIFARYYR